MKGCTTPLGSTPPTLYEPNGSVGSFTSHKIQSSERAMRWGVQFFVLIRARRLECLTICRCHNKGSTLCSVILRPWVLVWPGFEPVTSHSSDRHLSNLAKQFYWLQKKKTYKKFQTSIFVKSWEINSTCSKVLAKKFIHIHVLTYM